MYSSDTDNDSFQPQRSFRKQKHRNHTQKCFIITSTAHYVNPAFPKLFDDEQFATVAVRPSPTLCLLLLLRLHHLLHLRPSICLRIDCFQLLRVQMDLRSLYLLVMKVLPGQDHFIQTQHQDVLGLLPRCLILRVTTHH